MKTRILITVISLFSFGLAAQHISSPDDKDVFQQYIEIIKTKPKNKLFVETALFFLGSPYKAGTLEINNTEQLVANLHEFDCITFVETCLALQQTLKQGGTDYDNFLENLKLIRYRKGKIDGYISRLHYMLDWISDNVDKETVFDCTKTLGGKPLEVYVNYMSSHPQQYPELRKGFQQITYIEMIEKSINERKDTYFYIPKNEILQKEKNIDTGDIIFFTTSIAGLDITHTGIAYHEKNKLTFIHASSQHGKVIVNPQSLAEYCAGIKNNTGIMLLKASN